MSGLVPIQFGSLAALEDPHLVTAAQGLIANNCFQDTVAITGRTAYRSVLSGAVSGSGMPQLNKRFRPSANSQRFVEVIGGSIYLVQEPTSETSSDGTVTLLGLNTFGATDNVCGEQLNSNFYLTNDKNPPTSVRINSGYALETLVSLPTAALPSYTPSALSLVIFPDHTSAFLAVAGGMTKAASGITNWTNLAGTIGGTCTIDLTNGGANAGYMWENLQWLMVVCSPETISGGNGTFSISLVDANSNTYPLNTISDPPFTNGSPFCVFCNLTTAGLTSSLIVSMVFEQLGPTTDPFSISGFMAVPTAPEAGTVDYFVTYFNSVTGNESALQTVGLPIIYNNAGVTFPTFQAARWNYNAFQNAGMQSTNPDTLSSSDMFNKGIGLAYPAAAAFAPVYTFTGTIPAGAQYPNADTVRLWRSTPNGISLVSTSIYSTNGAASGSNRADGSAWTGPSGFPVTALTGTASDAFPGSTYWQTSGTTWSITDNTGALPNANQTYQAGGPMPPLTQMTAMAGRLAGIYNNQVSISSFTPVGSATNLIPQWPPIAIEQADGWAYNVSPAPTEIGQVIIGQDYDALYIGTSEAVRSMSSLEPGSPPFLVLRKGVVGRQAAGYFEDRFIWAGPDGVYMAANQSNIVELTEAIRSYYINTFFPDQTVVLGYQYRKLFVFKGSNYLRYDFVRKNWTTGTIADTVDMALSYTDVLGVENDNFVIDTFQGGTVTLALHTPDVGSAWVHMTAGSLIGTADVGALSNVRGHNSLPDNSAYYYNSTPPPSANYSVSMQLYVATVGVLNSPEICGRMENSINVSGGTYYGAFWSHNGGNWALVLQKVISGAPTTLGSLLITPVAGQTYPLTLSMQGNQISLLLSGSVIVGPITDNSITAANFAGLLFYDNTPSWTDTALFQGKDFTAGNGTIDRSSAEQLWLLCSTNFLGRWQSSCMRDMQIGTDLTTGVAPPPWTFSTGFDFHGVTSTITNLMADASGVVNCTVAKTISGVEPDEGRSTYIYPGQTFDEVVAPAFADFRAYKFRYQFDAANGVSLYRAGREIMPIIDGKGG